MVRTRQRADGTTGCALCGNQTTRYLTGGDYRHYNCAQCGRFWITGTAEAVLERRELDPARRDQLLKTAKLEDGSPWIDSTLVSRAQAQDLLTFPTVEGLRVTAEIARIQDFSRALREELRLQDRLVHDVARSVRAMQVESYLQINIRSLVDTTAIESLASSLRSIHTASLIAERLRDLAITRRIDLAALRQTLASHNRIVEEFNRMRLHAVPDLTGFALPAASRELLVTNHVVDVVTVEEDEDKELEEQPGLDEAKSDVTDVAPLLELVDPELLLPYQGVKDALNGNSADRTRQVLVSGRELWSHLLLRLAPTKEVAEWAKGRDPRLMDGGNPTRRARVLYICRKIDDEPLTGFVEADATAFLEHYMLFNHLHRLKAGFSDHQLRAIVLRTDSWLDFIIRISMGE